MVSWAQEALAFIALACTGEREQGFKGQLDQYAKDSLDIESVSRVRWAMGDLEADPTREPGPGWDVRGCGSAQTTLLWHVIESVAPSSGVASGMTHRAIVSSRVRFGCSPPAKAALNHQPCNILRCREQQYTDVSTVMGLPTTGFETVNCVVALQILHDD